MPQLKEYDLAYICYYSEKVELRAIAAGFAPKLNFKEINFLLDDLRKKGTFEFYKSTYEELLEE
ncbi:hypothetical protein ER45_028875 (plasmid) [Bacillus mycoides]|nr:hypothetical protein ER45_028875 [Bacillus mycoides]